jgi:two-component system, NtrC family, sensor histidine kinase HydH
VRSRVKGPAQPIPNSKPKEVLQPQKPITDLSAKIYWLMLVRVVFTTILLGSTLFVHFQADTSLDQSILIVVYYAIGLIVGISVLSVSIFRRVRRQSLFAYFQFVIDTLIVTLIIFVTGGFYSFFSFLYLVVIIYASMMLYFKGGLFVAGLSSLLYTILILLEFSTAILPPLESVSATVPESQALFPIVFKIIITSSACFAVAFLSGLLTEQNRKSQLKLQTMEASLKRVEKMAYMGEMAAGLAHEIKNPLASLVGSIQMLKEDLCYDADHERLMDIILRETDRLSSLVNDFLFFARPPAGKPEKINLSRAINEITDLFERDPAHRKRFMLQKDLPPDIWVLIDPTHLSQVLWNLLLNAAEAIDDDGKIDLRVLSLKNSLVQVQVRDNGCGMQPDIVQSIFDPFYTTKSEGTGLGLSIVHRILESYSSRLDVNTEPEEGTTFSFTLDRIGSGQT